jgi:ribosomal peptide maturation radical SAM protein 1
MPTRSDSARVLLIAMPWARLEHPSIQLGLLKAILEARGIASRQLHLYLEFAQHLAAHDPLLGCEAYDDVATRHLIGDWIFAVPPFKSTDATDKIYQRDLIAQGEDEAFVAKAAAMRAAVPAFLRQCVDEALSLNPQVIGFTTTFGQTVASLVMAQLLKRRAPGLKIVLGGANCDGAMGEALHRSFPWIDVVVRGEAEPVFGDLVQSLLRDEPPVPRAGLCLRRGAEISVTPMAPPGNAATSSRPFVEYDDYFERLSSSRFAADISPQVTIPFETSRGCWWGEKHHCTFCGLNGSAMTFRPFDPQRTLDEMVYLARRYQRLEFNAADNIMGRDLFDTMIPRLIEMGCDFHLFYEVKANLRKTELAQLKAAGITEIQPGLESLSTAALKRVRKGTTALQNIRLLKWCAALGIRVHWNIIHDLPGDDSTEYLAMAAAARDCFHLDAPNLIPLSVERFSPYHDSPEAFGIEVLGPRAHYRHVYPVDSSVLNDIAYAFEHRLREPGAVEPGLSTLRTVVDEWQSAPQQSSGNALALLRGPGFSVIRDRRAGRAAADYRLGEVESHIYEACDSGLPVTAVCETLGSSSPSETHVLEFLEALVEAGLAFKEGGRYLGLAVESRPSPAAATQDLRNSRLATLTEIAVATGPR